VLEVIGETSDHLSADEIAVAVADRASDVHRATVFRTLERLVSLGIVAHVHLPHGATTYHLREPHERMHLHLLCRSCGEVFDVEAGLLDDVKARVVASSGFELEPDHTALSGHCADCRGESG
jgi:Fur family ferric uptake transcriptional regulator